MKKIYKTIVALALVLIMSVGIFPPAAFADHTAVPTSISANYIIISVGGMPYRVDASITLSKTLTTGYYWETEVVQRALKAINGQYSGVNCDPGEIDGYFGQNTHNALYNFQDFANKYYRDNMPSEYVYSTPDGICGPVTWSRLSMMCS